MTNQELTTKLADIYKANPTVVKWDDDVTDIYEGTVDVYCDFEIGSWKVSLAYHESTETFELSDYCGFEYDDEDMELGGVSELLVSAANDWAEMALNEDRDNERAHMDMMATEEAERRRTCR